MQTKGPEGYRTSRLLLRRPDVGDAEAVFRYAADPLVTTYLAWGTHRSIADSERFLGVADDEWRRDGVGAYLICAGEEEEVIGSTGIHTTAGGAVTGYVLTRSAWGVGYATEALWGVVAIATAMGIPQLIAQVHVENTASMRVLEKCLFKREGTMPRQSSFPNLSKERSSQAWTYVRGLG